MTNATLTKFPGEADTFYLDCTNLLAEGDTISGTPVLSFQPDTLSGADALAFTSISVNGTAVLFPDGRTGKVGGVIVLKISGGTSVDADTEREYTVVATFLTASGNTKIARGRLLLLPVSY